MESTLDTEFRPSGRRSVSERVLDAIAEREGESPVDFDRPIYDVVDPDALDDLFRGRVGGTVEFSYLDYRVVVGADGRIDLFRGDG